MAQEATQPEQPNRAEQIRKRSAEQEREVIAAFVRAENATAGEQLPKFIHAVGLAIVWAASSLPIIAAELAEANSRDREAEIRAKSAEAFVAGIQAELARAQGSLVVPATVQVPRPKR